MWSVRNRLWIVTTAFLNMPIEKVFGPGSYPGCHWVRYPLSVRDAQSVYALARDLFSQRRCLKSTSPLTEWGFLYGVCSSIGRVPGCDSGGSGIVTHHSPKYALVVELVVTLDLGSSIERCEGSSPSRGTIAHIVQLDRTLDYESRDRSSNLFEGTNTLIVQLNRTSPF